MKILLLAPQPFYVERGTPIAVLNLLRALSAMGHQVDLLTFAGGEDVEVENLRIFRVGDAESKGGMAIGFSGRKLAYDAKMARKAVAMCRATRYDVIHAVEEAVYIGLLCKRVAGARLVYDMDSSMSDQLVEKWPALSTVHGAMNWFEGLAVKRSDRVIAVCQALADKAAGYGGGTPIDVLEDVVMEAPESGEAVENLRDRVPPGAKLMLYVGNLEHYQGVGLVLEALALPAAGAHTDFLVIGGTDEDIRRHREQAERLGIGERVTFLGPRPVKSLMGYLRQADILVSPRTKGVNTPMKIYSYLGSGTPILATGIASHTQVLNETNACLVMPTPEAMAAAIGRLAQDEEYARAIATQALRDAEERFSFGAFSRRLGSIYASL